eukprot:scaffold16137_cov51-Cyclotella_meneghiniana.AAC.3
MPRQQLPHLRSDWLIVVFCVLHFPLPLQSPSNYILLLCINGGGELGRVAGPKADSRTSQTPCCCRDNSWVAATAAVTKAGRIPVFVAAYQRGGGSGQS